MGPVELCGDIFVKKEIHISFTEIAFHAIPCSAFLDGFSISHAAASLFPYNEDHYIVHPLSQPSMSVGRQPSSSADHPALPVLLAPHPHREPVHHPIIKYDKTGKFHKGRIELNYSQSNSRQTNYFNRRSLCKLICRTDGQGSVGYDILYSYHCNQCHVPLIN